MEYLGVKGSNYYLIDLEGGEGYSFSSFGASIEKVDAKYVASICKNMKPVDILSILSDASSNVCEIYYKGKKALLKEKGMDVYKKIPRKLPKASWIAFRVVRPECIGLVQILIPFVRDSVSFDILGDVFGSISWM